MAVMTVDAGTSVIKAVLFDDAGVALSVQRESVEVRRPRPGHAEQDMSAVWTAVVRAVRAAAQGARECVRALAFAAQGHGCWPRWISARWKRAGTAMLWCDGRARDTVVWWQRQGLLDRAFEITGTLGFAGLAHAILSWTNANEHSRLDRAQAALTCNGWLFSCATGQLLAERSDASAPFLDPRTGDSRRELISLFGSSGQAAASSGTSDDRIWSASSPAEPLTNSGLPVGLPVVMAPYDVATTAIGAGSVRPGQAFSILGTTLCNGLVMQPARRDAEPGGLTISVDDSGRVIRAFATMTGTEALGWAAAMLGMGSQEQLLSLAAFAKPGSEGAIFLPYVSPGGERAPFLDTGASGTWWGLALGQSRPSMARSVLEGLSFVVKDCLTAATLDPVSELRLCGGGAHRDVWCQLLADVVNTQVLRSTDAEVGAKGAFVCGLVAIGGERNLVSAVDRYVRMEAVASPHSARAAQYAGRFEHFVALRDVARHGWPHVVAAGSS